MPLNHLGNNFYTEQRRHPNPSWPLSAYYQLYYSRT
ncbi:hypothetical protein V1478_011723, partial [Vespula squamosa]